MRSKNAPSTIPCSAPHSSPALAIPPKAALIPLETIEELPARATGALVFRDRGSDRGAALLENGRICWAMAERMPRRLTDILRHQTDPPLESGVVERLYRQCRHEAKPLGECLVESGVVSDHGLRSALRQHNAEALAILSTGPMETEWRPHTHARYDARYTFSTCDLLMSLTALQDPAAAALVRGELRRVVDEADQGAAYLRCGSTPMPIGGVGTDCMRVAELVELGRWASATLDLADAVDDQRDLVATGSASGHIVTWVDGPIIYLVLCRSRPAMARVVGHAMRNPGHPSGAQPVARPRAGSEAAPAVDGEGPHGPPGDRLIA